MFIVQSYPLAIAFCFITMLCWGSWGNTQKLAARTWRYELFYWDYVIGLLLFSVLSAFTLGSFGTEGRSFLADLAQADAGNLFSASSKVEQNSVCGFIKFGSRIDILLPKDTELLVEIGDRYCNPAGATARSPTG